MKKFESATLNLTSYNENTVTKYQQHRFNGQQISTSLIASLNLVPYTK